MSLMWVVILFILSWPPMFSNSKLLWAPRVQQSPIIFTGELRRWMGRMMRAEPEGASWEGVTTRRKWG